MNVFCQQVSIKELLLLGKSNYDKFDSIAIAKGYRFQEVKSLGIDTFYSYAYGLEISTGRASNFLQYSKPLKGSYIAYITLNSDEYLNLKNEAKKNGFSFLRESNVNGQPLIIYSKGNAQLQFITQTGDFGNKYFIRLRIL